ncbi:protein SRG1-like isoform X2 [Citrus sinensis]|uniref:protein SRG1-like isoform X2 n=1 Tax=Citrus sinensis TaxID=2711 RepID=UPI0022787BC3|nr:protein SRG1-like isoform X2 [Citrus sinensis]
MGMDEDAFLGLYNDLQALRVNYYPACCRPDDVLGISPHSDTSTITILMQEEDIKGLQIKHNGFWVPVKPVTDALVVNVGDVIEILSNGKFKSIEHRAVTDKNRTRVSYEMSQKTSKYVQVNQVWRLFEELLEEKNGRKSTH